MRKFFALREVVGSVRNGGGGGGWELCATAVAKYDTASSSIVVELDALVQPSDLPPGADGFRQPWLPERQVVQRQVPLPKARVAVQNVFRRWTLKVRQAVPSQSHHLAD